jgi:hypothetical protein
MDLYDRYRLTRAKRRYMPEPSPSRGGLAFVILLMLAAAIAGITIVERNRTGRAARITEYALSHQVDALAYIADALRTHRYLFLGDVAGAAAPKRFASDAIAHLARGPGLGFVALEIGADLQPALDRYLESSPEDATALLGAANQQAFRDYLGICRRVWNLNRELGADRRIRLVAIDQPGWPPLRAVSPLGMLQSLADREEHMLRIIQERILNREPRASILIFADGLQALRARVRIEAGGSSAGETALLANRLAEIQPGRVFSVIVDAPSNVASLNEPQYLPARLFQLTRHAVPDALPLAFPLSSDFPATLADLAATAPPGITLLLAPGQAPLSRVADLYIRF